MTNRNYLAVIVLFCGVAGAQAAPNMAGFTPSPGQIAALQLQADHLAVSISAVIQATESSVKALPSTDREATIQSAVQGAITASGDDPHVVLDTLQAFTLCPSSSGRYSVTQIPVTCANLKGPLSPEAREALASVEKVIVALVDQSEEPGALGTGGRAPFDAMAGEGGSGGNNGGNNGKAGNQGQFSDSSSIEVQPGPGGGGSSGYNTN